VTVVFVDELPHPANTTITRTSADHVLLLISSF